MRFFFKGGPQSILLVICYLLPHGVCVCVCVCVCVYVCVKEWKAESHIKLGKELRILSLKQGAYPQLVHI